MKFQIVGFTIGIIISFLGIAELIPALVDMGAPHSNTKAFLTGSLVCMFFGGCLIFSNNNPQSTINIKQAFLLTTLSWASMGLFASIPLYLSDLNLSFSDAFFEALSGITTTGSTILSGLDAMSSGILVWRSIIQWIGGIGIVCFAIVFLPFLRIGGMKLFRTESSDRYEKAMPKTAHIVSAILKIYCALTVVCAATYYYLGMSFFDAVNHALTTIPTGGYSTHDASFGYFDNPALQLSGSLFMLLGGLPFILYVKLVFQGKNAFFNDDQFKTIIAMLCSFTMIMTIWLWNSSGYSLADSFRYSVFNIISVVTTTGYATTDYLLWGPFAVTFFFFLTYLGACAGSTSGGLKTMRLIVVYKATSRQIKHLIYPNGVFAVHYQKQPIEHSVILTVLGFLGMYVIANVLLTAALTLTGIDFSTAISGAATSLANVGPGIGNVIGPAGNFSSLPDPAKWLLCLGMLIGRLEILTVAVLFSYEFWKD